MNPHLNPKTHERVTHTLRLLVVANRVSGNINLANIRIAGGSLGYCQALKAEAERQIGDVDHPIGRIYVYVKTLNNEFGSMRSWFRIDEVSE